MLIKTCSEWTQTESYQISKSLVAILGIGDYDGMANLDGIIKDYKNIIHTFYEKFNYSIIFKDSQNKLHYCNRSQNKKLKTKQFKIRWSEDEIDDFIQNIVETVTNENNNHDSMIFFISSHGESNGVILDSDCEEVQLLRIFYPFFGQQCPELIDKPKLFIVDACRGSMRSKVFTTTKTKSKIKANTTVDKTISINSNSDETKDDNSNSGNTNNSDAINAGTKTSNTNSDIDASFKFFDNDNDGMISFEDLKITFEKIGEQLSDSDINNIIKEFDKNKNNFIDKNEFSDLMNEKQYNINCSTSIPMEKDNKKPNDTTKYNVIESDKSKPIRGGNGNKFDTTNANDALKTDTMSKDKSMSEDENDENKESKVESKQDDDQFEDFKEKAFYHCEANSRFIYANPDGYAAVDGGINGGYLIQATKKIFCKHPEVFEQDLNGIIDKIRVKTKELVGKGAMQNVEDVNRMQYTIFFDKNRPT